ncbi:MAG: hypothetical protein O7D91_07350 [Planctomycetota bacterium]|nr:hypothetical protein [Planctomycetota bacterium]
MKFCISACFPLLLCLAVAEAQSGIADTKGTEADMQALDEMVTLKAQKLGDWADQHRIISDVINNIWEQNNWTSEADSFARETFLQIERIPPWQFRDRLEAMMGAVKGRYGFDDRQTQQFQQQVFKDMWAMSLKYGPTLLRNAEEMLDTRLRGEPFTAQQVARWAQASDPLIKDMELDVQRFATEFGEILNERQLSIYKRDRESLNRRMDYFVRKHGAWKRGKWRIEDWGLQDDVLHRPKSQSELAQEAVDRLIGRSALPYQESTWRRYVRAFVRAYELDEAQKRAGGTILDDLVTQADRYRTSKADEISKLNPGERVNHPMLEPIRRMFTELKARLEVIPTERQRKRALDRAPASRKPPGSRSRS